MAPAIWACSSSSSSGVSSGSPSTMPGINLGGWPGPTGGTPGGCSPGGIAPAGGAAGGIAPGGCASGGGGAGSPTFWPRLIMPIGAPIPNPARPSRVALATAPRYVGTSKPSRCRAILLATCSWNAWVNSGAPSITPADTPRVTMFLAAIPVGMAGARANILSNGPRAAAPPSPVPRRI